MATAGTDSPYGLVRPPWRYLLWRFHRHWGWRCEGGADGMREARQLQATRGGTVLPRGAGPPEWTPNRPAALGADAGE